MSQMVSNYQIGLNFLSAIALFVGAYLIYNSFTMNVVERTREYGMLRTIGMTRRQITGMVLFDSLIIGVAGSVLGVLVGIFGSRGLASALGNVLGADLLADMRVPMGTLVLSVVIGIGVTLISAMIPAIQAGKISPIEALRIRGTQKEGWLSRHGGLVGFGLLLVSAVLLIWNPVPNDPQFRVGSMIVFTMFGGVTLIIPSTLPVWEKAFAWLIRTIYGGSGVIGQKNLERSKSRTTLTVSALLVGVAMILIVQSMTASFAGDLKVWIESYMGGDLYVTSTVPLRSELARQLEGVLGVRAAAPVHYQPTEMQTENILVKDLTLMGVDPASYTEVTSFVFSDTDQDSDAALRQLASGGAVFVSSVLSEKYGLVVGDTVSLRTPGGNKDFEVAGVVVDFYNQGLVITGSWQDMRRYFRVNEASTILVRAEDPAGIEAVQETIEAKYGNRYRLSVEANTAVKERVFTLMDQAFSMFDLMAVLAVAVASMGVVNTLTMNIMERTREIGMLRAIGMTPSQVVRMVLAESALMGIIGGALGLAFGAFLSWIFLLGMTAMSGYKLALTIPTTGIILGLIVALVMSQLVAIQPAKRAARINVLEAVRYE
jgi:putative ABC transport system permease protein